MSAVEKNTPAINFVANFILQYMPLTSHFLLCSWHFKYINQYQLKTDTFLALLLTTNFIIHKACIIK